jgi:predicted Fe-Mo cluster-binding NifX family protein
MKIAIPTFGARVSPRFDCAQEIAIVNVQEGGVLDRRKLAAADWTPNERIDRLLELGVDTVICGGIDRWSTVALQSAGVTIYGWLAGEVEDSLAALLNGDLDDEAAMQGGGRRRCRRFAADNGAGTAHPVPARGTRGRGRGGRRHGQGRPAGALHDQATQNSFVSTGGPLMSSAKNRTRKACVIAIPVAGGHLCTHFGHCEQFTLLEVDTDEKKVLSSRQMDPPPHEPGLLPRWLHEQGVDLVIAGGMGRRAQGIFAEQGIEVLVGAPADSPDNLARSYLDGTLRPGENVCDH